MMDFLQSTAWRDFQAGLGKKTFLLEEKGFWASIIEHQLPIVGKYFYLPRGPVLFSEEGIKSGLGKLAQLAQENQASWIRIEPEKEEDLELIKKNCEFKIRKASKNVQPREIFVIDLRKSEEDLLKEMKPKTRYNLKLAQKKGVTVKVFDGKKDFDEESRAYLKEFVRLTEVTAKRNKIRAYPGEYYQKMFSAFPPGWLKLYVAEYQGKTIGANLVVFFEKMAIYLHGASDDQYHNVMAPFLLQWEQIKEAKKQGCESYDFGGVALQTNNLAWQGITRFKKGFSPNSKSLVFPGTFDLVLNKQRYFSYRFIQFLKNLTNY